MVIRDQNLKDELGRLYAEVGTLFVNARGRLDGTGHVKEKVVSSSAYLVENYAKAPALVMCAIWGIHDNSGKPGLFDSGIQSAWSFNLALRSRGLGTVYATMLNEKQDEVCELLGIPPGVTTLVCFPVAYTKGHDFSPVPRRGLDLQRPQLDPRRVRLGGRLHRHRVEGAGGVRVAGDRYGEPRCHLALRSRRAGRRQPAAVLDGHRPRKQRHGADGVEGSRPRGSGPEQATSDPAGKHAAHRRRREGPCRRQAIVELERLTSEVRASQLLGGGDRALEAGDDRDVVGIRQF